MHHIQVQTWVKNLEVSRKDGIAAINASKKKLYACHKSYGDVIAFVLIHDISIHD